MTDKQNQNRLRKGSKTLSEALSWVGEGVGSLKRVQGLECWPFPTYKGQPLEPVIYPKQPRVDPQWPEALL
jgi:hypothetical protein